MSYIVKFSDTNKTPIEVVDQTLNKTTDVTLIGKNYVNYASTVAENFLHLLENFASSTPPSNPIEGQIWYDSSISVNKIKVYDGTNWIETESISKSTVTPLNPTKGDLWSNIDLKQLYLFTGDQWVLVGPQYTEGDKTGAIVEVIMDTTGSNHTVISLYAGGSVVAIVSNAEFTPNSLISGFGIVYKGITLNSINNLTKFAGTASKAESLLINNVAVNGSLFFRKDQHNITDYPITIRNDTGLEITKSSSLSINTDAVGPYIQSNLSGKSIRLVIRDSTNVLTTLLSVNSSGNIGIGRDNLNPTTPIDLLGNTAIRGNLTVTVTNPLLTVDSNGVTVQKLTTEQISYTNRELIMSNDVGVDPVLIPDTTERYDIGTSNYKFKNIYAKNFYGTFNGVFDGITSADVAEALATPSDFSLSGEITSNVISFDGSNGTAVTLSTAVNNSLFTNRQRITVTDDMDDLLIYPGGNPTYSLVTKIRVQSRRDFLAGIASIPVGTILPFAGQTPPSGRYLFCDGSEVAKTEYPDLYDIIGDIYGTPSSSDFIVLPDMRARFPLGADIMGDNGQYTAAGRIPAAIPGYVSGASTKTLISDNIPDHIHKLTYSDDSTSYYALRANTANTTGILKSMSGSGTALEGYPFTGKVSGTKGQAFDVMNPYQAINYIIYAGRHII